MFIFDSLPFTKGSWNDKRQDDSSIAAAQQQHGVCLFSTPNILQNFTISSDPSLIHLYSKPNDSVSTANDGMEIDQTTLDYQRTFSFIKKPEEKQAFSLLIKEDQVNYHPIVQKVVLKLHRPSKQQSKGTRCKSIPPVILLSRREENFDELQSRQEILRQLDSI